MPENTTSDEATLVAAAEKLTQCDGYVVLAVDPQTGELRSARSRSRGPALRWNWKPLAIAASVVLVALVVVFAIALAMELT